MKEPLKEPSEEGDDIADESEMVPSEEDSDGGAFSAGGGLRSFMGSFQLFFLCFCLRVPLSFLFLWSYGCL